VRELKDKDGNTYTTTWFDMFRVANARSWSTGTRDEIIWAAVERCGALWAPALRILRLNSRQILARVDVRERFRPSKNTFARANAFEHLPRWRMRAAVQRCRTSAAT
jgi:hypothetical protein